MTDGLGRLAVDDVQLHRAATSRRTTRGFMAAMVTALGCHGACYRVVTDLQSDKALSYAIMQISNIATISTTCSVKGRVPALLSRSGLAGTCNRKSAV